MTLLPPKVIGPLSECSSRVKVEAQITGATVYVFANGAQVATGVATSGSQVFNLTTNLSAGESVVARQEIGAQLSAESPESMVVQAKPPQVGLVAFRSHLFECGRCIWMHGAVPGATVTVSGSAGSNGSGNSYDGNARFGLSQPIGAGETLQAVQEACGQVGPKIDGPTPDRPVEGKESRQRLPAPSVNSPLRACQKGVTVSDVYDGADVTLLRASGSIGACFDVDSLTFRVNPVLVEGETVRANQAFPSCTITSPNSAPVVVGPAKPVPPPKVVGPLCEGATSIRLTDLEYGSMVKIFVDGNEIGTAESPVAGTYDFFIDPPLPAPNHHGTEVTAQQELCGIYSAHSAGEPVMKGLKELPPPKVSEPLFDCSAAVHVSGIHSGAYVRVFSSMLAAPIASAVVIGTEATFIVAPLLMEGDEIFAVQKGCGAESPRSNVVRVKPLPDLKPPNVKGPVYHCHKSVVVTGVVPGALVEVYVDGIFRGAAVAGTDEVDVPIIGTLSVGSLVQARQHMCGRTTKFGEGVRVAFYDGEWIQLGGREGSTLAGILAVHAALLRTNKIVYFGGDQHDGSLNANSDVDHTRLFDCDTFQIDTVTGLPGSDDLFCAGHAQLADGRIITGGGTHRWPGNIPNDPHGHGGFNHFLGARLAYIFDPADHQWHKTGDLVTQRPNDPDRDTTLDIEATGGKWYPSLLTLADSRVLAVTGHPREFDTRHNNNTLERYSASSGQWSYVGNDDCALIPRFAGRTLEYPRLFVLPGGDVISTSELADGTLSRWHTSDNPNNWTNVESPKPGYGGNPLSHTAVLLPLRYQNKFEAKILIAGHSTAWVLDPEASSNKYTATARVMTNHPAAGDTNPIRSNLDGVILPTGEIFIEGGAKNIRNDATGVKKAEMFDPEDSSGSAVGTWRVLPEAQEVRNYHSVARLMPNGAVWVAGSNFNSSSGLSNRNLWIEIYKPWYFCYPRPKILVCPDSVRAGSSLTIRTPDASKISRVVLVRTGTCTHNFNPDQRLVEIECRAQGEDPQEVIAITPGDSTILIPGQYLLFVINQGRVPSVGKFIKVLPARKRIRPRLIIDDLELIMRRIPRPVLDRIRDKLILNVAEDESEEDEDYSLGEC